MWKELYLSVFQSVVRIITAFVKFKYEDPFADLLNQNLYENVLTWSVTSDLNLEVSQ